MTEKENRNPKPSPETMAGRLRTSVVEVGTMRKEPVIRVDTQSPEASARQLQVMVSNVGTLPKGDKLFEAEQKREK